MDPYKVLGVTRESTDEQIKEAYRALARKYHPDQYEGGPLQDLAGEKMKEVNEAYDLIISQRRAGEAHGASGSFGDIRRLISQGRLEEADELLDGVPAGTRDAEWEFLKGSVFYSKGWMDAALEHFNRAVAMNPQNQEYKAAQSRLLWQRQGGTYGSPYGQQYGRQNTGMGCSVCDICTGLMCADCLCRCCF